MGSQNECRASFRKDGSGCCAGCDDDESSGQKEVQIAVALVVLVFFMKRSVAAKDAHVVAE